jgi:AraC-like DNA-binding protein
MTGSCRQAAEATWTKLHIHGTIIHMTAGGLIIDHATFGRSERRIGFTTGWRILPWILVQAIETGRYRLDHAAGTDALRPGSVWLVPAGCRHRHTVEGQHPVMSHHVHLIIRRHGALDVCAGLGAPRIFPDALESPLGRALRSAATTSHGNGLPESMRRHAQMSCLASALIDALGPAAVPDPAAGSISPALAFIDANLHLPITRSELAARAGCRLSRLHQLFLAATGEAPMGWIRRRRLVRAAELLAGSDLGMSAIAERCGFYDAFHLNKRFRAAYGLPPTAWRRQARD